MTNRFLTTLAIRFAALLLLMKIFDSFAAYFLSAYYSALVVFSQGLLQVPISKLYYSGLFLALTNVVISSFLFFKAEWISCKLIKDDSSVNFTMTPAQLIKVILLTTGIIWLAASVYMIPDAIAYIQMMIDRFNKIPNVKNVDFNPVYYLLKTTLALLFVLRAEKISQYIERKKFKAANE